MVAKHFKFSDATAEQLRDLAEVLELNQQDVVREALRIILTVTREARHGHGLGVIDAEGNVLMRLIGIWDEVARQTGAGQRVETAA